METKFEPSGERIIFERYGSPEVSIVILTYNNLEFTMRCLESIRHFADSPYELIIVDNGSKDATRDYLSTIDNVTVIENEENLGFVKGCNQGAEQARADLILFLNNDTEILANSLSSLLDTIKKYPDCGAVGGKLVWPNKALQEAGSIIWRNGETMGYGRGRSPEDPECSYLREVDYCSAACLLVRKDLFDKLGGFDERYAPAYYEDADLCLGIWQLGYKVVFQPRVSIIHNEFSSSTFEKAKSLMERNRARFVEKWGQELEKRHEYSPKKIQLARDRSSGKRILIFDDRIPTPNQGCGFPRAYAMLETLANLGYKVTFCPVADTTPYQPFLDNLRQQGIEAMCGQINMEEFFGSRAGLYEAVIISRPLNMERVIVYARQFFPEAAVIYDAEALFFMREELKAKTKNYSVGPTISEMRAGEFRLIKLADSIITVSELEKDSVCEELPGKCERVFVWGHPVSSQPTAKPFKERKDVLFVGSFLAQDSPNEDAVIYFANEVFPLVQEKIDGDLLIVGMNPPAKVRGLASPRVHVEGFVENLSAYYESCKLFVVPHLYSAGIPLKLCEAMGYGLPAVVSELTAKQLSLTDAKEVLVGQSSDEFAAKVASLYNGEKQWAAIRKGALEYIENAGNPKTLAGSLERVIGSSLSQERITYIMNDTMPAVCQAIVFGQIKQLRDRGRNAGLLLLSESVAQNERTEMPVASFGYREGDQVVEVLEKIAGKKIATDWLSAFILSKDAQTGDKFYLLTDIEAQHSTNPVEARALIKSLDLGLKVIATSKTMGEQIKEAFGFEPVVVEPGIDTSEYYDRKEARDYCRILHIDDHDSAVNQGFLSAAIEFANKQKPGLSLAAVMASDDRIPELLASAGCCVVISGRGCFGRHLLEAMACGCPVVTARDYGTETFCEPEKNCLMVESGDHEAIGQAILRVLEDDKLREALVRNGLATAKKFDQDKRIKILESVLGGQA